MGNRINRLSELTANQIAAGEVVQRPASVVKELMENAIDAGANVVMVGIGDGGRSFIKVVDDGCGMSFDDAVIAFERHATSKIINSDDLYRLSTFGFRGEALPSIASVAEVELRTMQSDEELGTFVVINGGDLVTHSKISTTVGTQFCVKNLFYNIPARRKGMCSVESDTRNIVSEFKKIALCYPKLSFILQNNDKCVYNLPITNLRTRVSDVVGSKINKELIEIYVDTPLVEVKGYIGRPQGAKKSPEQYLFVNGRYFKSSFFNKMIVSAYENLLVSSDVAPQYFIYIKCDPSEIDVNIHPSKIEVKFESEEEIAHIIKAAVRASLGKNGIMPMIDFEGSSGLDIPIVGDSGVLIRNDNTNRIYNPNDESFSFTTALFGGADSDPDAGKDLDEKTFDYLSELTDIEEDTQDEIDRYAKTKRVESHFERAETNVSFSSESVIGQVDFDDDDDDVPVIQSLDDFLGSDKMNAKDLNEEWGSVSFEEEPKNDPLMDENSNDDFADLFPVSSNPVPVGEVTLLDEKYILTSIGDDIYVVDVKRAMNRIMYERYRKNIGNVNVAASQKLIFPTTIPLQVSDKLLIDNCRNDLHDMGFIIEDGDEPNSIDIVGVPMDMGDADPYKLFEDVLDSLRTNDNLGYNIDKRDRLILTLSSIATNKKYSSSAKEDMRFIIESLRQCEEFSYSPAGKPIIVKIGLPQIKKILN